MHELSRKRLDIGYTKTIIWSTRRKRGWWSGERTSVGPGLVNRYRELDGMLIRPDHCIEMMRVSIMCRGDPSLSTFKWLPGEPLRLTAVAMGHHQCVNWDSLLAWVRQRAIPLFEPGTLAEPEIG